MANTKDTIAAIATPPGRGSVGILRLSGPKAKQISKTITGSTLSPRYAHYSHFLDPTTKEAIDQGLALFFPNPHSFTGEDVLELQCHGGPVILDQLLTAIISINGVRLAKPGEFSERAFLNNKIDLTQAEAIADLINATSQQATRNAMNSLQGIFSNKINEIVEKVTQLRIYTEAAIDFPEEEIDFLNDKTLLTGIDQVEVALTKIFYEAKQGSIIQEGINVVIAGKPNAGKSSLLNALAGRDSAIVTNIPGTTRDVLKEHIHLDNIPLHIIDTAGLRESSDEVEKIGIERAWTEINKADCILLLVDITDSEYTKKSLDIIDLIPQFISKVSEISIDYSRVIIVYNKSDLVKSNSKTNQQYTLLNNTPQVQISAKTGSGLDSLTENIKKIVGYQQTNEGNFTARRRHLDALKKAQKQVKNAKNQLVVGAGELVAEDLRQAQKALGEITGQVTADELLGKIFSSFCIGK